MGCRLAEVKLKNREPWDIIITNIMSVAHMMSNMNIIITTNIMSVARMTNNMNIITNTTITMMAWVSRWL
jgi:hypothetical protein